MRQEAELCVIDPQPQCGATLSEAHLKRANLRGANTDNMSRLNDAILTDAFFDQVTLDNVNLTVVDRSWSLITILGDVRRARMRKGRNGKPKPPGTRRRLHRNV
jgi:Pentapeptide repeats (8 copies)